MFGTKEYYKIKNLVFILLHLVLLTRCTKPYQSIDSKKDTNKNDSIYLLIEISKNPSTDFVTKKSSLWKAYSLNKSPQDTLRNFYLTEITNQAYIINDTILFKRTNAERLELSKKLKDTLHIGESHYLYGNFYFLKQQLDSSYYYYNKANKIFESIQHEYFSGRMLFGMAAVKKSLMDFTGSEKLAFEAIKKLKPLKKNTSLYLCFDLLGMNYYELKEFDKSIFYNQRALEYLEKAEYGHLYVSTSLNNIGMTYEKMGNHLRAIEYFKKALNEEIKIGRGLNFYADIIDNLHYNRFRSGDTIGVEEKFMESLNIKDSLQNPLGITTVKLHLAEYHAFKKDTTKAIKYAQGARYAAENAELHGYHLEALKLLSEIDKTNKNTYLETYIELSDSLRVQERSIRNKSTRIEYETDEYIEETKRLTTQNILISVIGGILVLVLGLLYFIRRQRAKNKELLFEQEQQRANEEIYSLMLKQQTDLEEGRSQERHRISEELHDGILGKLFGARVGMGFLELTGDQEDVKEYKSYLGELRGIEKEIRDISHALKNTILKTENSFISVIEQHLSNQSKVHGFAYTIEDDADISWPHIDDKLKVTLYRIIQEATQNIVKHANASKITVVFNKSTKFLHLTIKDDGKGFIISQSKNGIGLKNMASRIAKHQGEFILNSEEGQGTCITVNVSI